MSNMNDGSSSDFDPSNFNQKGGRGRKRRRKGGRPNPLFDRRYGRRMNTALNAGLRAQGNCEYQSRYLEALGHWWHAGKLSDEARMERAKNFGRMTPRAKQLYREKAQRIWHVFMLVPDRLEIQDDLNLTGFYAMKLPGKETRHLPKVVWDSMND